MSFATPGRNDGSDAAVSGRRFPAAFGVGGIGAPSRRVHPANGVVTSLAVGEFHLGSRGVFRDMPATIENTVPRRIALDVRGVKRSRL